MTKRNYSSLFFLILSGLVLISCVQKKTITVAEKHRVISYLLDTQTIPILTPPPPPPNEVLDTTFFERDSIIKLINSDSWKNQKLSIALVKNVIKLDIEKISRSNIPIGFEFILDNRNFIIDSKPIDISFLKTKKNHLLTVAPSVDSLRNDSELWRNFDVRVNFSETIFNRGFDKAVICFAESFGRLNSASYFVFLTKEKGSWSVVKSIAYEIS